MSQQVIIFDTTLRDGEQALQASLSVKRSCKLHLHWNEWVSMSWKSVSRFPPLVILSQCTPSLSKSKTAAFAPWLAVFRQGY